MITTIDVWVVLDIDGIDGGAMTTTDIIAVCTSEKSANKIKTDLGGYADIDARKAVVCSDENDGSRSRKKVVYLIDDLYEEPILCDLDLRKHQENLKKEALKKLTPEQIEALKELGLD